MNTAHDIRELTAEELNAIAGGSLHVGISLGWIGFRVDITKDGMATGNGTKEPSGRNRQHQPADAAMIGPSSHAGRGLFHLPHGRA
jgi:hypothetical protein